ncbi:MAG TPA: hypothetical protein VF719_02070, partial [Abditibacteriaceae bacterium]
MRLSRSSFSIRLFVLLLAAFALLAGRAPLWAASPLAGTEIVNQATLSFTDDASGLPVTLTTNTVRAIVQPVEGLDLTADNDVSVPSGSNVN